MNSIKIQGGKSSPYKQKLEIVENEEERFDILKEGLHESAVTTLWMPHKKLRIPIRLEKYSVDGMTLFVQPSRTLPKNLQIFKNELKFRQKGFVNFNLGTGSSFFEIVNVYPGPGSSLLISIGLLGYLMQRRDHLRMEVSREKKMYVSINGRIQTVENLSAGGMRIEYGAQNMSLLKKGQKLETIAFHIHSKAITCNAEIKWVKKGSANTKQSGLFLAGIEFTNIRLKDKQAIDFFIKLQCYDYIRFINNIRIDCFTETDYHAESDNL
jgi:hypothetical protein